MAELHGAFSQEDITPARPLGLAGYFNERISTGVIDPLFAKAAVFDDGATRIALVICDLVALPASITKQIRVDVEDATGIPAEHVLVACTHTHTGPLTEDMFGLSHDPSYVTDRLIPGACAAVKRAVESLRPLTAKTGAVQAEGLAFNRRYWMKNGRVITNPPKGSGDVVKPEGPVDHTLRVYAFESDGETVGLFVSACNHTDTTGGCEISADWPGVLAEELCKRLGVSVPVMILNGLAGNINHFDPKNPGEQTSRDEAVRIGKGYADFGMQALETAGNLPITPLAVKSVTFDVPYRDVSEGEIEAAHKLLASTTDGPQKRLTSEDLAKGDPQIERFYARSLIEFAEVRQAQAGECQEIAGFRLGDAAFVGFPGEPFVEIGMAVQERSPFKHTTVFELLGDCAGYIPLPECFERGGYEPRTHPRNRLTPEAADMFIERATEVLKGLC